MPNKPEKLSLAERLKKADFTVCPGCVHAFGLTCPKDVIARGVNCAMADNDLPVPRNKANACTRPSYPSASMQRTEAAPLPTG